MKLNTICIKNLKNLKLDFKLHQTIFCRTTNRFHAEAFQRN